MEKFLIKDCPQFLSGIYKLTFPNGKSYIGLSNNIKRRMKEHLHDMKVKNPKQSLYRAAQKYGLSDFEILERIEPSDREKLCEREKYWIEYYHTYIGWPDSKGYNETPGGDGASCGTDNSSSTLTQKELEEIIQLLISRPDIYIYEIGEQYHVSAEAISNINRGVHYYNSSLSYPLRHSVQYQKGHTLTPTGINHPHSKFSQESLLETIDLIKNSSLTFREIGTKMGVSYAVISQINQGKKYKQENMVYPLRTKKATQSKLSKENLMNLLYDLQYTNLSYAELVRKYGICDSSIRRINSGQCHKQDNLNYPLR